MRAVALNTMLQLLVIYRYEIADWKGTISQIVLACDHFSHLHALLTLVNIAFVSKWITPTLDVLDLLHGLCRSCWLPCCMASCLLADSLVLLYSIYIELVIQKWSGGAEKCEPVVWQNEGACWGVVQRRENFSLY